MALRRLALCPSISARKFIIEFSQQFKACRYISVQSKDEVHTDVHKKPDRFTPAEVCQALYVMCRRQVKTADQPHQATPTSINQNDFDMLYKRVNKLSMTLSTGKLINLVQSLNHLNSYIQDTTILRDLESQALSKIQSLTFSQTATLLKSYKIYNTLDMGQVKLFEGARTKLIQLLDEKPSFDNLITALQLVSDDTLPKSILDQLEDKLLEELSYYSSQIKNYGHETLEESYKNGDNDNINDILETSDSAQASPGITYNNLSKLFVLLAHNGRRPLPLLKITSDLFVDLPNTEIVHPSHSIETLSALSRMQYPNHQVLDRILKDLVNADFSQHLSANNITTLLTTLSRLQWVQEDIMRECLNRIKSDDNGLRPKDLVAFICTCATLNHKPADLEAVYKAKILDIVKPNSTTPSTWLKYVWSLAILDLTSEADLMSVLNEDFHNLLQSDRRQQKAIDKELTKLADTLKLLNLQSFANHTMGLTNIKLKFLDTASLTASSVSQQMFSTGIIKALKRFLPITCIETNVATPHGFKIDVLIVTNNKFEPIPHDDPRKKEYLSKDFFNCALLITGLKESICNKPDSLVGSRSIQEKILKSCGYRVVFIPQTTFGSIKAGLDLTIALRKYISDAISR